MSDVALVTGASSGIGAEFAKQLSAGGYEVILVARRAELMEQMAAQLSRPAHVIACDLVHDAPSLASRVADLGLQVDLLVNNAGFGTHGRFAAVDAAREAEEVRLNCEAVASTAGMQPIPYEATYSASKAFARTFSDALSAELRGTGVRVLCVNPGPVPTDWQRVAGYDPDYLPPVPGKITAARVAKESLRAFQRGRRTIIPGFVMRWYMRINSPAPLPLKLRVVERMYRPAR